MCIRDRLITIFYATYANHKSSRKQFEKLKKRIAEEEINEIKYDFNKFNTNVTRNAEITTDDGIFFYSSGVKYIQIANETLGLTIQSILERKIFRTQLFIKPFVCELFDEATYRQFDLEGTIIFSSLYLKVFNFQNGQDKFCLLYTSPSPRDATLSRMPSSA